MNSGQRHFCQQNSTTCQMTGERILLRDGREVLVWELGWGQRRINALVGGSRTPLFVLDRLQEPWELKVNQETQLIPGARFHFMLSYPGSKYTSLMPLPGILHTPLKPFTCPLNQLLVWGRSSRLAFHWEGVQPHFYNRGSKRQCDKICSSMHQE